MAAGYWVELRTEDDRELGAAFHITRTLLLTADHCLRTLSADERKVVIVHDDDSRVRGEVCERKSSADLALIRRIESDLSCFPPPADVCRSGDRWRTPNRPSISDPCLNGWVHESTMPYRCEDGAVLNVLQLWVEGNLGTFKGYSGGAVERVGSAPALAGVLVEEFRDRIDGVSAAGLLFAVTMREAMDQFADYFTNNPPETALCHPTHTEGVDQFADHFTNNPPDPLLRRPTLTEALDAHTLVLKYARDWQSMGLISPAVHEMLEIEIARSIVDKVKKAS